MYFTPQSVTLNYISILNNIRKFRKLIVRKSSFLIKILGNKGRSLRVSKGAKLEY